MALEGAEDLKRKKKNILNVVRSDMCGFIETRFIMAAVTFNFEILLDLGEQWKVTKIKTDDFNTFIITQHGKIESYDQDLETIYCGALLCCACALHTIISPPPLQSSRVSYLISACFHRS